MLLPLIITAISLFTAIVAVIAAKEVIWDESKNGWRKLNLRGYVVIPCAICMSILPLVQYFIQNDEEIKKEMGRRAETVKHDTQLRKEYETSVSLMKKDFDTSSDKTLRIVGQILAKQNDSLDIANKRIIKLMHDSGNIKMVLPDQPVFQLVTTDEFGPAINFLKFENGFNHYSLTFMSQDGSSCCYDLKISAVVLFDTTLLGMAYKGPVRMALTGTDNLAKDEIRHWSFTIDNSHPYNWLYLWVRGTYGDRNGTHTYKLDKVYYNHKSANTFGDMQGPIQTSVIANIRKFEK